MLDRLQTLALYEQVQTEAECRELAKRDLFFLAVCVCSRVDMNCDFIYYQCRSVENAPDGYLDLWAREHYKSTIITVFLSIQEILKNPNITIGIFSHTRVIAKSFLKQIKREFETNTRLQELFPHIIRPQRQESRTWNDEQFIVKRDGNPKEATIEAWGLVDGQPTGKHFDLLIYDDVVTLESVSTPDQIKKTTDAWRISLNLGAHGGRMRMIGTRYHLYDTYHEIMEQGSVMPRIHSATADGTEAGNPVFLSRESLAKKRRDMGAYVFACQMLQDPKQDNMNSFKDEWIKYWNVDKEHWQSMNRGIFVDPASSKKEHADYTSMWVIGRNVDGKYYVIYMLRDRLSLVERTNKLFSLVRAYGVHNVAYEQYGAQADIEHIQFVMDKECFRFNIVPVGGKLSKFERVKRLESDFEQGNIYLPSMCPYKGSDGKLDDMVQAFVKQEYLSFPMSVHDDMLDSLARIYDCPISVPNVRRLGEKARKAKSEFSIW